MGQSGAAPDIGQLQALVAQGHEIPVPTFGGAPVAAPQAVPVAAGSPLLASGSGAVVRIIVILDITHSFSGPLLRTFTSGWLTLLSKTLTRMVLLAVVIS